MIGLKDIKGNVIYTTGINVGAKRKITLMKEDYVTLPFSLSEPIEFGLGTSAEIDGELFEVTDLQKPSYNGNTGGYDYQLRLDAYYWKWKNKIFKFTPEVGGQEASWSLTASLDAHLGIFLKNLKALGYTYRGIEFEFSIDATVENKAMSLVYENTNMIDALSAMAEAWECEWWVTDNLINFGRCEYGIAVDFEIGRNVAEMTRTESKDSYATRLYVFGSTRNIPTNYRPTDESLVVNGIVQKRLMLPEGTPYIDAYEGMPEEEAIEEVVVIEEIYPKTDGNIDSVETYTDSVENEDGTTTTETFYRFKDGSINFSKDYILEGEELRMVFQSGSLNGMEFGVIFNPNAAPEKNESGSWNPDAQLYEIVANEDYGRKLPDDVLKPKAGDRYILINWDSTKIAELGLVVKAEQELLEKGREISEKRKIDPNTYGCKMMSDYMYGLDDKGNQDNMFAKHFSLGDRVSLIHPAYFEDKRESRIIGVEYNLDYKFDNPVYTVGESGAYSRLGALEDKIDAISFKGQVYTGGGGSGVYVIGTNDATSATDRNVYSALRSEQMFLRKDKSDRTPYGLAIGGDLTLKGKQISNLVRYYDAEKPEASDVNIYSSLMTDMRIEEEMDSLGDKFLRKDKEDTAHKHITFEEGITVYQLAKLMNLEVEELATISQAIVDIIGSANFRDGFAGEGYQIWKDIATGDWSMTLDRLTVRKMMYIYELIIQKIRSVGGMIVVSAGNGKVKEVVREGIEYKFTFEDVNTFAEHDLMRCQTFTGGNLKNYWVEVTRVVGDSVYARVADFEGVIPEAGDECVLMGNTQNPLRQNLILISATEDGKPVFDCYNGVKGKSFEGCLRTRVGCLDGIRDDRFPSDMQPKGYGLYADNCYLTGVFVLSNGNEISTQFTIMEGMLRSEISSVRAEINAQDNYLSNASFASNLEMWEYNNDVRVFNSSGGLLHFNNNFYSIKNNFAGVVVKDSKNVLRIKKSFIMQKNEDYNLHPSFDLYENEETGVSKYRPRMFYVSFKYLCVEEGTIKVYFKDETNDGTFESYAPINVEKLIVPNVSFTVEEFEGKWNGTGDFYLEFDGDIYIYDLALSDNALADVEEKFTARFEQTDKKIQANLDYTNGKLEEYHSEFKLTAQSLESTFNTKLTNQYNTITSEYTGKITQTAKELRSEYTELVEDAEKDITSSYESLVSQTAREIRAELREEIEDTASGLEADYEAQISATARELRTDFNADITDLETGLTSSFNSSISQTAKEIRAELTSVEEDLDGRVTENETNISVQAGQITSLTKTVTSHGNSISSHSTLISQNTTAINLRATKEELNTLSETVSQNSSDISITADDLEAFTEKITFNSSGEITNFSKSGLYTTSNRVELYSSLVSDGMATKASLSAYVLEDELGELVSKIDISADQIDLTGKVTFNDLNSSVQSTINGKLSESTIISGGYIKTSLIDVDSIVVKKLEASNSEGWKLKMDSGGFVCENSSGTPLLEINADGLQPAIGIYKSGTGNLTLNALGFGYTPSSGGATTIDSKGLTLASGAKLYNFSLGNVTTGSPSGTTDFTVLSSSASLPSASSNKGKVIFIKFNGSKTLSGTICPRNSNSTVNSVTHDSLSAFYISNGSYWYEFLSVD